MTVILERKICFSNGSLWILDSSAVHYVLRWTVNRIGFWILLVSFKIWLWLSKLTFSIISPFSLLESLKIKVGQLDINLKRNHYNSSYMPVAEKNHQRHSNCRLEEFIRLLLPAFTLSENILSQTSRNRLDRLPAELRNWNYSLLQSLTTAFLLFP